MNEAAIIKILKRKNEKELRELLLRLCKEHPHVASFVVEDDRLNGGDVQIVIESIRGEIEMRSEEQAWWHSWNDEGHIPDYSNVTRRLRALLDKGYADEVVALGEELVQLTRSQLEEAYDDGELSCELSDCVDVVVEALMASSMDAAERILWLTDLSEDDEHGIASAARKVLDSDRFTPDNWWSAAKLYEERLISQGGKNTRDTVRLLTGAYEKAGRKELVIPLMKQTAGNSLLYHDLVKRLIESGDLVAAREWAIRGYEGAKDSSCTRQDLRDSLCRIALYENKFDLAASYLADKFMSSPSKNAYAELLTAVKSTDLYDDTRAAALSYLKTGERDGWPLPPTEIAHLKDYERPRCNFPNFNVLIDIAIMEGRHDDTVALYLEVKPQHFRYDWKPFASDNLSRKVADAVSDTHVDFSLDIWRRLVEGLIDEVKPDAYRAAAPMMRSMREAYKKNGRSDEWEEYATNLRFAHKAKRRLMEVLHNL